MMYKRITTGFICLYSFFTTLFAQERTEPIPFGDFERWTVRIIKEAGVLGGNTRMVYMVAPNDTIRSNKPYLKTSDSPWGSSNVMANVMGIVKTSTTVFPEARAGGGYAARLDTKLVSCKVLGMVNITVLASGSVFLGEAIEPIRNANNPLGKIDMGIPFTGKPKALQFDYKAVISSDSTVTVAKISSHSEIPGRDRASVFIYLQNRWEDENGNLYAKRIGTGKELFGQSVETWVDAHRIEIHYGDISTDPACRDMKLIPEKDSYYSRNSRGKMVPVREVGWGTKDDGVTHMVLMISSGCFGAYVGALGNSFWVDNVQLVY